MADKEKCEEIILEEHKNGNVVTFTIEGPVAHNLKEFIKQPVDGLLYDLNRLEEVALSLIDDPKYVNDFAVAKVIRELYRQLEELKEKEKLYKDALEECRQ
jgi:hypothetical protein